MELNIALIQLQKNGKLLAHSVYQTEFTAGLGATIAFQHTECDPIFHLFQYSLKKLKYSGQIAFDFIVTKDGKVYPIECNPRTTSGLHLFFQRYCFCICRNKYRRCVIS
ncbi:hypothetical protein GCM10020331_060000 [Ectobacillus funiculus]